MTGTSIEQRIVDLLNWIACYIKADTETGYGDPSASSGDQFPTDATWRQVVSCQTPTTLLICNMGAFDLEISAKENQRFGFPIPALVAPATVGGQLVLDRFRGTLYARSTGGASILQYCNFAKNVQP